MTSIWLKHIHYQSTPCPNTHQPLGQHGRNLWHRGIWWHPDKIPSKMSKATAPAPAQKYVRRRVGHLPTLYQASRRHSHSPPPTHKLLARMEGRQMSPATHLISYALIRSSPYNLHWRRARARPLLLPYFGLCIAICNYFVPIFCSVILLLFYCYFVLSV